MKKTSLIVSIIAVIFSAAALVITFVKGNAPKQEGPAEQTEATSTGEGIAYFNLDEVIAGYQMAIDLQQGFESKAKSIDEDVTRRRTKLEAEDKDLADKLNKGLVTRSVAEVKYNDLQKKIQDFQLFGQQKQNELAEEQQVILNNIADAITKYVNKYNVSHNYTMIFSTQGALLSTPVVTAAESVDITAEIIAGLNQEYSNSKSKK